MNIRRLASWAAISEAAGRLLVAGPGPDFDGPAVTSAIRSGLEAAGATVADVTWEAVAAIPRTAVGKAPLVRADLLPKASPR